MRNLVQWAIHLALDTADLVAAGVPIPAIVAARAMTLPARLKGRA